MAFKMKGFSPFTKIGDQGKTTPGAIAAIEKISKENPNIDKELIRKKLFIDFDS